ncbi:hypothetical protein C5L31_002135 [Secundilactobacillus malefermentans]|uniref:ABC-2 type transporter transmembrane domain-containing protein n=1 Tax=Secundilactobacillus malefermentans TaxID=176292 RepID=A0A4R5NS15_9LACO|nr:YhgE/Pip domain-containing protein [Secundilactobacillus malefermentans]TDG79916.1 hypothetical protein C5L31_002135 [Secundilactobacillus malefermentans]
MSLLKAEWKSMISKRWTRIVMVALIFIPSLYAVIFLASLWDAYGKLSDLPVAIVNQDKTVSLNGTKTNVGNRLVKNLHNNNGLKWEYLNSESKADKGLKDGKYYMVLTIPKDFSKNSTTVLNKTPKQMDLSYKTAAGHSFIGEKMTTSAATQLKNKVSAQVTKTYAKTMFDAVKSAGSGLTKASNGAGKLDKGTEKLEAGDKTLNDGLQTLSTSTLKFKSGADTFDTSLGTYIKGVSKVNSGAKQVSTGLNQYVAGVATLNGGAGTLSDGLTKLGKQVSPLAKGVDQLNTGAKKLDTGLTTYTNGVKQVYTGANSLSDGLIQLRDGSTQLAGGMDTLDATLKANSAKIDALSGELTKGQTELKEAQTAFDQINVKVDDILNQTDQGKDIDSVVTLATNLQTQLSGLSEESNLTQLRKMANDPNLTSEQQSQLNGVISDMKDRQTKINAISSDVKSIKTAADSLTGSSSNTTAGEVAAIQSTLQTKLNELNSALTAGSNSMTQFAQLQSGVSQLTTASHKLNSGLITATNSQNLGKLVTGIGTLNNSSSQLTSGANQIYAGTSQMAGKMPTLTSGVNQLVSGGRQVASGTSQLNSKSGQLSSGAAAVASGTQQLASNGTKLQNGADTIDSSAGQLATGAGKLASGSKTLNSGLGTLGDGTHTLHTQLAAGAKQVAKLKATPKTYKMMSTPVKEDHDETAPVENNGTGMTPYMISVGLFVGGLTFTIMYDLYSPRKYPNKGSAWWASKASVVGAMAILQSIAVVSLLMIVDGLHPLHPWATFGVTLLTALAFLSLISLFAVALGKVGSFIMLVFMVLQLSGSAGTYPIELSNGFFEAIHGWLPMTYSIDALRNTLSIGGPIGKDVLYLFVMLIVSNLLWLGFYFVKHLHFRFQDDGTWTEDHTGILDKIR